MQELDISRLTQLMRDKVKEARRGRLRPLDLAVLLWAACTELKNHAGITHQPAKRQIEPVRDYEAAGELLTQLGAAPSATDLYHAFLCILVEVETRVDLPNEEQSQIILLEELQRPAPPLLRGEVQVWVREASLLQSRRQEGPEKEAQDSTESGHHAMKYLLEPDRHLRFLTFVLLALDRPDVKPLPRASDRENNSWRPLVSDSAVKAQAGCLRMALCPLRGSWYPQFKIFKDRGQFVALPRLAEPTPGDLDAYLDQILRQVVREPYIHILVFPELSLDLDWRQRLREKLRRLNPNPLLAVFAGTYHVGDGAEPVNEAEVWDPLGNLLWSQQKQGRFRLERWQVLASSSHQTEDGPGRGGGTPPGSRPIFFPDTKEEDVPDQVVEGIRPGSELVVVDTGLGRLVILICADALEPGPGFKEAISRVRPDLVFILAMTPKTAQFEEARNWLFSQDIGSVFVNAACVCQKGKKHRGDLALFDLSLHESGDALPTRWRWGVGEEDAYWYRISDPRKPAAPTADAPATVPGDDWRPRRELEERGIRPAVEVMPNDLGLIIDLGQYLRRSANSESPWHTPEQ